MILLPVPGVARHNIKNEIKWELWLGGQWLGARELTGRVIYYAMAKYLVFTIICNTDDEPNKPVALGERLKTLIECVGCCCLHLAGY